MSTINNFELTKPIPLFDTIWKEADLMHISRDEDEDQVGDMTAWTLSRDFFGITRFEKKPKDVWVIDWSAVPDTSWNEQEIISSYQRIGQYKVAYLRFIVSVLNGRVGDSMLFLFNQPNTTNDSGLHAGVHLEIGSELTGSGNGNVFENQSLQRASSIGQHFIKGWDIENLQNGQDALNRMKNDTEVRFLGLAKQANIEVIVKCMFLGGMY